MRDRNRLFHEIKCDIQKSIKLDNYTYDVLNNYRGYNFSERIRNYVFDKEREKLSDQKL